MVETGDRVCELVKGYPIAGRWKENAGMTLASLLSFSTSEISSSGWGELINMVL